MTFKAYVQLFKLRIAVMIALTAVMGYVAMAPSVSLIKMVALVVAMMLGSASSAIFNHFYDQDIDRLMKRTASRPFASGQVDRPVAVLLLAAVLLASGVALSAAAFNLVVALHLFLGAFVYAVIYTVWLKRRTWLNIVIGGAAGSFAVLAGGAAVDPGQWMLPTLMAVTLFLWTPSHFWSLAIMIKDDYRKAGVPMLPVLVGNKRTAEAILLNSLLLVTSTLVPWAMGLQGRVYGVLAAVLGAGMIWAALGLLRHPEERKWARYNFFGSMLYLVGLFIAVLLDVNIK